MPRRSLRQSDVAANTTLTPSRTETGKKRAPPSKSGKTPPAAATKSRKRSKTSNVTSKRSRYFSGTDDEEGSASSEAEDESDFQAAEDDKSSASPDNDEDEDDASSSIEDVKPARRRKSGSAKRGFKPSLPSRAKETELWREGAETGFEPGTEIIIKKPKARPAGNIPYREDTVHPNTLLFLKDLKANNDREWLKMHDPDYRASLKDWNLFVEATTQKLTEIDETVPELPLKDIVFRIYRDIRFSPDPTPYKPHFSAAWSRTGRKGPYAAYYLQISAGDSFIGGGCWYPEAQLLAKIRRDIDQRPQRIRDVLLNDRMRKEFLGGVPKKPEKAIEAFVQTKSNVESALKTKPKGYEADHKDISLLRLKSFTIGRRIQDNEVTDPRFLERVADLMSVMLPFITYLNNVVMPDASSEGGSDEGSDTTDIE